MWLWPRVSWRRSTRYFTKRVLRVSARPYAVAMGCAVGAFVSFTPFVGLHFILTFLIAWPLRGNLIAGAIGTAVGNPLTFPFIWMATYKVGHMMMHGEAEPPPERLAHDLLHKSFDQLWPLIKPMTLGAIPLGLVAGAIVYFLVYNAVSTYQLARRARFAASRPEDPEVPAASEPDPSSPESLTYGSSAPAPRR